MIWCWLLHLCIIQDQLASREITLLLIICGSSSISVNLLSLSWGRYKYSENVNLTPYSHIINDFILYSWICGAIA